MDCKHIFNILALEKNIEKTIIIKNADKFQQSE